MPFKTRQIHFHSTLCKEAVPGHHAWKESREMASTQTAPAEPGVRSKGSEEHQVAISALFQARQGGSGFHPALIDSFFCSRMGAWGKGRLPRETGAAGGVAIADGSPFLSMKPSS